MTILEQIQELLKLHGIHERFDRIDVALNRLYEVEMNTKSVKTESPKAKEERKPKKEAKAEEEHLGI